MTASRLYAGHALAANTPAPLTWWDTTRALSWLIAAAVIAGEIVIVSLLIGD